LGQEGSGGREIVRRRSRGPIKSRDFMENVPLVEEIVRYVDAGRGVNIALN